MEGTIYVTIFILATLLVSIPKKARKKILKALLKVAAKALWKAIKAAGLGLYRAARRLLSIRRNTGLVPTKEERKLLRRLAPHHWKSHRERRGLDDTLTGRARLTNAGIVVPVRLDGKWTVKKFTESVDGIKALTGARHDLKFTVNPGKRGGWATLTVRTRSAADGDDMLWSPEVNSFGVDTVTGQVVDPEVNQRLLIAGMSGSGKSTASRPLMYKASEGNNLLVIIDLKMVEARLWDHRARVALTPEEVVNLVSELVDEMFARLSTLAKGSAKVKVNQSTPRLIVVVDEGAEVNLKVNEALEDLETLARLGRAAEIHIWWLTQKPLKSGKGAGIPTQIAGQMETLIGLAVSSGGDSRVIFGDDAQEKGWTAEDLEMPGYALVRRGRSYKPHPVRVRYMSDEQVVALPERPIWYRNAPVSLTKEPSTIELPPVKADPEEAIIDMLKASDGPVSTKVLLGCCPLQKSQGHELLNRMVRQGKIRRQRHGHYELAV